MAVPSAAQNLRSGQLRGFVHAAVGRQREFRRLPAAPTHTELIHANRANPACTVLTFITFLSGDFASQGSQPTALGEAFDLDIKGAPRTAG